MSNNEKYNQIIDEVYKRYTDKYVGYEDVPNKELFVHEIKTNPEFSEKWGLKIEERELILDERLRLVNYDKNRFNSIDEWIDWYNNEPDEFYYMGINYTKETALTDLDVPIKLITITYNNKTIEVYE